MRRCSQSQESPDPQHTNQYLFCLLLAVNKAATGNNFEGKKSQVFWLIEVRSVDQIRNEGPL